MPPYSLGDDILMGHGEADRPAGKPFFLFTARFWTRRRAVIFAVLLGLFLRLWSAWQLPIDADEPVYLRNANDYAQAILRGDWSEVMNYSGNSEHPPLVKLMYAAVVAGLLESQGERATFDLALFFTRLVSVVFGTLAVLLVALMNPLAGVFLAIHTYVVKYTSETYLEALPLFASVLSVYALHRAGALRLSGGEAAGKPVDRPGLWFWISAAALGLTAAGKYSYFPVFFVVLFILVWQRRYAWKHILLYLGLAAVTFFALNPYLWPDPIGRLAGSLFFHVGYAQGPHVQAVGYPWFQPLLWLTISFPFDWHPDVFFYYGFDGVFFVLALASLQQEWKERRWLVVWICLSIVVLLLWPTKWPQYTLMVAPAICLAAASGATRVYHWAAEMENTWGWFSAMIPRPNLAVKILAGLFFTVLIGGAAVYGVIVTYNRVGWSNMRMLNSGISSDTVYDIQPLPDGRMVLATGRGISLYYPPEGEDLLPRWDYLTQSSSGLPGSRVTSIAQDAGGGLWFGASAGAAYYDWETWDAYPSAEMGLPGAEVISLAISSTDGRVWAGTSAGAAVFDGTSWEVFTPENSAIASGSEYFLSAAVMPAPQGDQVFFGAVNTLYRYDTHADTWESFMPDPENNLRRGGVSHIMVDSTGRLWVTTLGSGIGIWDGSSWTFLTVGSSDLPYNTVQEVIETEPGTFWISTGMPVGVGGVIVRYDGFHMKVYTSQLTGYSGAEALSIAESAEGHLWFGTYTAGVDIFNPRRSIFGQY